jgi:Cdc6-like AAA superfamily ATPase
MNTTPKSTNRGNGLVNPFPATPVARLSPASPDFMTIETAALRDARAYLLDYLKKIKVPRKGVTDVEGGVIAIVGDYGTGKTHIAHDLLRIIQSEKDDRLHSFYLDAPSDTFLALYRERFIPKLDRRDVVKRVEDCYANILAEELQLSELTAKVADGLRDRTLAPSQVMQRFGISESEFIRRLGKKLKIITEKEQYATALLLLLRPEFHEAVWEWLGGSAPDKILQERGVIASIDTDADALEAIGVLSFLFGYLDHRFILVIDEIEKVISHANSGVVDPSTLLAFKKLMEVMSKTRALLVVSGLPEFLELLPEDTRQRVSCVIRPSRLSGQDTIRLIKEAHKRETGAATLDPFSIETANYITTIAGGNIRRVLRLCFHAYHAAALAKTSVSPAMIREAARDQFELSSTEDIANEIIRVINQRGWAYEQKKMFGEKKNARIQADFWLPIGNEGSGCVLKLTRSIMQDSDVVELTKEADALKKILSNKEFESLLVINGYLAEDVTETLRQVFSQILVHKPGEFVQDCDAVLVGLRTRLQERHREDALAALKTHVEEITRQNSLIMREVETTRINNLSRHELQGLVSAGLRSVFGLIANNTEGPLPLPSEIEHVFERRRLLLNELLQPFESALDQLFGVGRSAATRRGKSKYDSIIADVLTSDGGNALFSIMFLGKALRKFEIRVSEIVSSTGMRAEWNFRGREELGDACQSFDRISSDFGKQIGKLPRVYDHLDHALSFDESRDNSFRRNLSIELEKSEELMRSLGREVYESVTMYSERR